MQKKFEPKNGGLTGIHRIAADKDRTKFIKEDSQQGESIYCSNYLFLYDFIPLIPVQMIFIG
jgi:hypothetical protein